MAPNPSYSNSATQMDPLRATAKVAKAIMSAPTGNGRLVATILSAYDLPYAATDVPTSVTLSYTDRGRFASNVVSTGPPAAKHRDHANSFKFGAPNSDANAALPNQLVVSAPLPTLFDAELTFTLTYADPSKNLSSKCLVNKTLRVNETQWLILNLDNDTNTASAAGDSALRSSPSAISNSAVDKPTLRLKLRLEGPYRPEIAALIRLFDGWFNVMDIVTDTTGGATKGLVDGIVDVPKKLPALKLLLLPGVPLTAVGVVAAPILVGLLIVGMPIFLPLFLLLLSTAAIVGALGSGLYFSTRDGRTRIQHIAEPTYQTFLMTTTGQRIIYDVGPRPSPQALAHAVLPEGMIGKLIVSLTVDFIGSASYLLPIVGEGFDVVWAPISMVLIGAMYDVSSPALKYFALMEELLPFTDIVPSATLGWMKEFGPGLLEEGKKRMEGKGNVQRRQVVVSRR
ncbi:hypothetical protein HJC23_006430 [Cyclotella cryptica]|uniref:Uncharacterized protein n=1 Tax=Cyclotella cryptica TaxID=29204 RepID=A0ABD3QUF1_9STRA|eukprot:CCRYP_001832-RB/>CCRYP_001832-RB protein AED:0.01 eAED:0.01 QI:318/-1/1/1/-1/1/1/364/454